MTIDWSRKTVSALTRIGSFAAVAALAVACSSSSSSPAAPSAGSPAAGGTHVSAALSEFKIDLGANTAQAGSVSFDLKNDGTTTHEFVVFRTDLAPDNLPLSEDGTEVNEDGPGITAVDEVEDIGSGSTANLTVDLPAGHYVLICNLPAHYTSGMHAEFTSE